MTTYNTYQEAKIANPEMEVYKLSSGFIATNEPQGVSVHKCDPAEHCVRYDDFLTLGHEFVDGDAFLNSRGEVVIITNARSNNRIIDGDDKRFILRAAALETKEPKRTKERYEKVNFDYAWQAVKAVESGEIFCVNSFGDTWIENRNVIEIIHDFNADAIHRRIETPVDWWEDAAELINQHGFAGFANDKLEAQVSMTRDQWCDFARILLEQGE